jgi:4-hydroxy-L-threonine phosphate dehydrogenase PdxA
MGDPTGIRPEILVRALAEPRALEAVDAVVVGDVRAIGCSQLTLRRHLEIS